MAKKWIPTQKQLSIYDELLRRQNEVRKQILRRRRIIEEEGAGRTLPDLVVPKKARRYNDLTRYRFNSYEEYRKKLQALKSLYGLSEDALKHFYKVTYRDNILGLIKDWIESKIGYKDKPADRFGKYSEEQIYAIEQAGEGNGRFLELYNKLISIPTEVFMVMYDSGMIPALKYIYNEFEGKELGEVEGFISNFSDLRRQAVNQSNIMTKSLSDRPDYVITKYNKRTRKFKVNK